MVLGSQLEMYVSREVRAVIQIQTINIFQQMSKVRVGTLNTYNSNTQTKIQSLFCQKLQAGQQKTMIVVRKWTNTLRKLRGLQILLSKMLTLWMGPAITPRDIQFLDTLLSPQMKSYFKQSGNLSSQVSELPAQQVKERNECVH